MFKFNGVKRITNKGNDTEIYEKVEIKWIYISLVFDS